MQDEKARSRRDYQYHELPILKLKDRQSADPKLLITIYKELCQSWRVLLDIRFKLLALVPVVSFALIAALASASSSAPELRLVRLSLAILGLLATLGLYIYEMRNSELYKDLGSRARRAEYELGLDTGQFYGRYNPRLIIDHKIAVHLVYLCALGAWLVTILAMILIGPVVAPKAVPLLQLP